MPESGEPFQLELFAVFPLEPEIPSVPSTDPPAPGHTDRAQAPKAVPEQRDLGVLEGELNEQASQLASELGLRKLARKVAVHWNPRMRTTAGRAFYDGFRIELNPGLLSLEGIDGRSEIDRTLRHELAHLVAHLRARGRRIDPHGNEWRHACSELGIPGESRCHTLPFPARQVRRKYLYECPACGTEVPRVRKFRFAVACYNCCRKHTGGSYDDRFRLKPVRQKSK